MIYEWDAGKAAANLAKHGVRFEAAEAFDWDNAIERVDDRRDYGERRIVAMGLIGSRLHIAVYTPRAGRLRIISLRKASPEEEALYAEAKKA